MPVTMLRRRETSFIRTQWPALLTIIVVVWLVSLSKISDFDIWFHIESGEYYWNTKSLPHTDPFIIGIPEGVRDISEWLSELLMFFVWSGAGSVGLQLVNSLVLVATFLLLYRLIQMRECERWLAAKI